MSDGRYVVLGLRRSGLAVGEAIRRTMPGAEVVGVDDAADRIGRRQAGAAQADDDEAVAHRNLE